MFFTAFNTAVALAEFEKDMDKNGKILLKVSHLEQVAKMSKAFQTYLHSTLGQTQAAKARDYKLRNDELKG